MASERLKLDLEIGQKGNSSVVLLDGERVGLDESLDGLEYGTFQVMSMSQRGGGGANKVRACFCALSCFWCHLHIACTIF